MRMINQRMINQCMIWPGFPVEVLLSELMKILSFPFLLACNTYATVYRYVLHVVIVFPGVVEISISLCYQAILCSSNHVGWDMQSTYIQLGSESSNLINVMGDIEGGPGSDFFFNT